MSKLYSLTACENLIDKYVNDYNGGMVQLEEGILGLGKILLYGVIGKKVIIIKEVYLNANSSSHTIRSYNKIPKKYNRFIQ